MTGLAPSGTHALGAVVFHAGSGPARCSAMAGLAIHGGSIEKLCFRNVVGWFGQSANLSGREVASVMAGLARCAGNHGVVHGDGGCKLDLRPVAGVTLGGAASDGNVVRRFGHG